MEETLLVGLAGIVVLTVGGQILAASLRLPSILVLLVLGMIAGPVTGLLRPDELLGELVFPVVSLAVAIILFEGGLLLDLRELRGGVSRVVRRLLLIGFPLTAVGGALAARFVLGLPTALAAVLGAILTVSGPTVVLPLLRFISPARRVASILKWEGIFVDAFGAALAVLAFEAVVATGDAPGVLDALLALAITLGDGAVFGALGAWLLVMLLDSRFVDEHFTPTVTIMLVLGTFTAADLVRAESGLLAAIVMGVVLANQERVPVRRIGEFKETLGELLTGVLFVILSARLALDSLLDVAPGALLLVVVLVLVVRPVAAWVSTFGSTLGGGERALIAWMAPRGIVAAATASLFALRLEEAGLEGADELAPITFIVILATVAVYGLTGVPVASALGVSRDPRSRVLVVGDETVGAGLAATLRDRGHEVVCVDDVGLGVPLTDDRRVETDRAIVVGPDPEHNRVASRWLVDRLDDAAVSEVPVEGRTSPAGWAPPAPFGPGISYETLRDHLEDGELASLIGDLPPVEEDAGRAELPT